MPRAIGRASGEAWTRRANERRLARVPVKTGLGACATRDGLVEIEMILHL